MYLKKIQMKNFRKYREKNNTFAFVSSGNIRKNDIKNDKNNEKEDALKKVDVASATTLIVGKNNTGKTSVIQALLKTINNNENYKLQVKDINFHYLREYFQRYLESYRSPTGDEAVMLFQPPVIEFVLTIAFEENSDDVVTNLVPFMLLRDIECEEIEIIIKYEISEMKKFEEAIIRACKQIEENDHRSIVFQVMLKELEKVQFQRNYYQRYVEEGEKEPKEERLERNFRLSDLIDIKCISANNVRKEKALTDAFNKIISYRYNKIEDDKRKDLDKSIDYVNARLTNNIRDHHHEAINNAIGKIVASDVMKVNLSTDITEERLIRNFLLYEYEEKGMNIPEEQFGLGYTHLVMIIAELIDYMEHYPKEEKNSKINLIAIEEPEAFMHPQMQELFIKNINEALNQLIDDKQRTINSQLIVTTHSSHILNSKIHIGNSFDDISYVYTEDGKAGVINLNDEEIMPDSEEGDKKKDFAFLKKHIKYKVSELFFADAVILVEGFTEDTILPFYLEQEEKLNKRYISIFGISGAHAFFYEKLLMKLKVPALIITDLDIKREKDKTQKNDQEQDVEEIQEDFSQTKTLEGKSTTNKTIKHFHGTEDISDLQQHIEKENIYIAYQWKVGEYYPTSFEEAFILTNAKNKLLNSVLKDIKPGIYKRIVMSGENIDFGQNIEKSYEWQMKLANVKSEFASVLLYALVSEEEPGKRPVLPEYIEKGLEWLAMKMKEGDTNGITGT